VPGPNDSHQPPSALAAYRRITLRIRSLTQLIAGYRSLFVQKGVGGGARQSGRKTWGLGSIQGNPTPLELIPLLLIPLPCPVPFPIVSNRFRCSCLEPGEFKRCGLRSAFMCRPRIAKRSSRLGKPNRGGPGRPIPASSQQKTGRAWLAGPGKSDQIQPLELIPLTFIPLPVSGLRLRFHSLPPEGHITSGQFSAAYEAVSGRFQSFPLKRSDDSLPQGNYRKNTGGAAGSSDQFLSHGAAGATLSCCE
jgi:hypothetical protein